MEILSAASPEFQEYGRIVGGCEAITAALVNKARELYVLPETGLIHDDPWLWARNKWLLAHPDSGEAKAGAYVCLVGNNIDLGQI